MPTYQAPRSDEGRLTNLETARDTAIKDIADAKKSITADTLAALKAFVLIFRPLYEALTGALSGRMKEVREREEARAILDTYVRDFYDGLKRRAHRLQQPAEILALYGLDSDGAVPMLSTFDELVTAADKLVQGDGEAVAKGFPAMSNPSAAELAPVIAEARLQAADVPTTDRAYAEAQVAIATQRARADQLIEDVMLDLASSLRNFEKPTQRRLMRGYGATFIPLPGEPDETVDPIGGTTPAVTPPPAEGPGTPA